jgi:hypothetical protein
MGKINEALNKNPKNPNKHNLNIEFFEYLLENKRYYN